MTLTLAVFCSSGWCKRFLFSFGVSHAGKRKEQSWRGVGGWGGPEIDGGNPQGRH